MTETITIETGAPTLACLAKLIVFPAAILVLSLRS
jgi:hypothetical protein